MIRISARLSVLVLSLAGASLALGQGGVPEPGTTPLFAGKDLTGWRYGKGDVLTGRTETADKRFFVADNILVAAAKDKDGKGGVKELLTTAEFSKDFVLKLDFRAQQEATGFLLVRNGTVPIGDFVRRGEQTQLKKFKNDDWNELEVTVKLVTHAEGRVLTSSDKLDLTFANGKSVATLNGKSIDPNPIIIRVEPHPRCNGEALHGHSGSVASRGSVGVRTNNGKIEFRNIRIRELP